MNPTAGELLIDSAFAECDTESEGWALFASVYAVHSPGWGRDWHGPHSNQLGGVGNLSVVGMGWDHRLPRRQLWKEYQVSHNLDSGCICGPFLELEGL
jgi:hypothetical protein